MTLPTSIEAVAVIVLLFIPGYILQQSMRRSIPYSSHAVDARYFFGLIVCGGFIHLLFAWWTPSLIDWYRAGTLRSHALPVVAWVTFVIFLTPMLLGPVISWVMLISWVDRALSLWGFDRVQRMSTAWMYSTSLGPRWVRVHLKDGTVLGGVFQSGSFSDDTGAQDIFLEQVYNLNDGGDFGDPVPDNVGIWISHDSISHMLFFKVGEEVPHNGTAEAEDHPATATEDRE